MESEILFPIATIFGLLMLSAFFSGSETALTAVSEARMHKLESDGDAKAARVNFLIRDRERLIGAILLGNNLVNILASVLAGGVFVSLFGDSLMATAVATGVMTALVLIFAEVTPKSAAIARPDGFAMMVAPIMRWVVFIFAPITHVVQIIVRAFLKIFGVDISEDSNVFSAHDELRGAVDLHHSEGRVDKEARDLLRGALELDDLRVEEIMIHRKSIEMLDIENNNEKIIQQALKSSHTRLPLFREAPDNIIGILHAKDLLRALWDADGNPEEIDFSEIARIPYFVPETTTLQEQLDAFKIKQEHFALVVDEYGALMGLVTMEDILEEIVGEIEDEYDSPVQGVRPQPDGSLAVDGDVTIRDLNRAMDWNLPDDEAVTIAGLVIHEAQSIPEVGQIFSFHDYRFKILRRRRNQITAIRVSPIVQDS
ncbi:MAG: HlyC/CorC family transporter [Marinicaulis sp.]|nr:HlyC/CorC family transporter [Marinicaulis sp.]NNE41264.1 HlyC/CorC family transporter [Marinicaulis sp.]NNL89819.1 HlyC/CorC family transporter [Marinicaulis sp.]